MPQLPAFRFPIPGADQVDMQGCGRRISGWALGSAQARTCSSAVLPDGFGEGMTGLLVPALVRRQGIRAQRRLTPGLLLRYESSMTAAKRKVSLSLDAELVQELEGADETLSKQVNDAVRSALERRRRRRLLGELLAELDTEHGPVPQGLVEKYASILQ